MRLIQLFETNGRKILLIIPGGYQPITPNHTYLYDWANQQFTGADVFLASSNNTKERPFNFKQKQYLATQAGIPKDKFVEVVSPYKAQEITKNYDPANTILIFAFSSKDAGRLGGPVKKNGELAYIQPYSSSKSEPLKPFNTHAYYVVVPETSFQIGSESISSASQVRKMYTEGSENDRAGIIRALYPNSKNFAKIKSIMDDVLVKKKIDEGIFQKPILSQEKQDEIVNELWDHFNIEPYMSYVHIALSTKKMDRLHLGSTLWANRDILRKTSDPVIYGITINPDACRDEKIFKAVVAHELCHVEDLLVNYFPAFENLTFDERDKISDDLKDSTEFNNYHSPTWLEIAARINGIFGPNYVTPTSDDRFKYNLLGNVKSGKLFKESKKITEEPDFNYSKFNNRDEEIKNMRWSVKRMPARIEIRVFNETNGGETEAGHIFANANSDDSMYVGSSGINGEWIRTGLGQMLYDKLIETAKRLGYSELRSGTIVSKYAHKAWKRLMQRYPVQNVKNLFQSYYILDLTKVPEKIQELKKITEEPDFGYTKFNNKDEYLKTLVWKVNIRDKEYEITAYDDNGAGGYIIGNILNKNKIQISAVQIDFQFHGTGLGQLLYDKLIQTAKENGYKFLISDFNRSNAAEKAWLRLNLRYPVKCLDSGQDTFYQIDLRKLPNKINESNSKQTCLPCNGIGWNRIEKSPGKYAIKFCDKCKGHGRINLPQDAKQKAANDLND